MVAKILALISLVCISLCNEWTEGIGYRIGNVTDYKLLKTYNKSKLYEAVCA